MHVSSVQRPRSRDFPWYMGAMVARVAVFLAALRAASTAEGRRHLDAGAWLIATLLAILAVSHYGEFGPLVPRTAPRLMWAVLRW